jgi:hypothetical protein
VSDEIAEAFVAFAELLRPSGASVRASGARAEALITALLADDRVITASPTGSYAHGTAVSGASAFDVLVVLRNVRGRSLGRALGVLDALAAEHAAAELRETTGDSVLLLGASGATLRLIPAYQPSGDRRTDVPTGPVSVTDAARRWVAHRPGSREVLLSRIDADGSVRRLIRLLLAWKHHHAVPVSSYYLETAAIRQSLQQPSFSPLWDVCWIWESLADAGLVPLPDLTSPSQTQPVKPGPSLARSIEAGYPVERAASSARRAVNAYVDGDLDGANSYLAALFGPRFPVLR